MLLALAARRGVGIQGLRASDSPAMGGNRMARKPRKMSLPHMLSSDCCLVSGLCCMSEGRRGVQLVESGCLQAHDANASVQTSALPPAPHFRH